MRASAAGTARSDQVVFGFGSVRRTIATSCPSARISAPFDADDRAGSANQDNTVTGSRQASETSTSADHAASKTTGQAQWLSNRPAQA